MKRNTALIITIVLILLGVYALYTAPVEAKCKQAKAKAKVVKHVKKCEKSTVKASCEVFIEPQRSEPKEKVSRHTEATEKALTVGTVVVNGWVCWADDRQPIDGDMPYMEYYEMNGDSMDDLALFYDVEVGKALHDKYCNCGR